SHVCRERPAWSRPFGRTVRSPRVSLRGTKALLADLNSPRHVGEHCMMRTGRSRGLPSGRSPAPQRSFSRRSPCQPKPALDPMTVVGPSVTGDKIGSGRWCEPIEGLYIECRARGSSKAPTQPESVALSYKKRGFRVIPAEHAPVTSNDGESHDRCDNANGRYRP